MAEWVSSAGEGALLCCVLLFSMLVPQVLLSGAVLGELSGAGETAPPRALWQWVPS